MNYQTKGNKMRLIWINEDFTDDMDFILVHQKDGTPVWWHRRIFDAYSDLDYDYCWNKKITENQRFDYITKQMKIQAVKCADAIRKSITVFENTWQLIAEKLNAIYGAAFDNDCSNILNDMKAEVGLNPICPRNIQDYTFHVYYKFEHKFAMSIALHEITHFVWFYFWQKHFKDNRDEYNQPNLKWLLSEIVVETIIRNSEIEKLTEHPKYIAYSYFYDMKISGEFVFDIMKKLYLERKDIFDFMEKSFDWIKKNEPELRANIAAAEN